VTPVADTGAADRGWAAAWPDALAFAGGLALAWFSRWQSKDLVWSLWLSSLLVGYATIVWSIFGPVVLLVRGVTTGAAPVVFRVGLDGLFVLGGLFTLGFFTFHFGMFHFVHSVFLNQFFPLLPGPARWPESALYLQVVRDYWPFVLLAAVAERSAFRWPIPPAPGAGTAVTAVAIAARKSGAAEGMMAPYRNVIRMHLLIFFFAFASVAKLDNFAVYAVVYAAYFFPWRLVKKRAG
jgi:hypothetical protein